MCLRQLPEPQILGDVGVLILVDQDRAKAALIVGENLGLGAEQGQTVQQEVAEIARVEHPQALLIGSIELARAAQAEIADLGVGHPIGRDPAVLLPLDDRQQGARGPALGIKVAGLDHLLDQAQLVVGVDDREVGLEADQLGVAAQQARAQGVEGAEPQALDAAAEQRTDPLDHLARGLVGEGHGEHLVRAHPTGEQQMGKPRGQHPGLAGAGAGKHQERAVLGQDGRLLLRIEPGQIRCVHGLGRPGLGRYHVALTGHETPRSTLRKDRRVGCDCHEAVVGPNRSCAHGAADPRAS